APLTPRGTTMSDLTALGLALVLLLGNAFFVGAEFALISSRRTQIEPRAQQGSRRARTTLRAMEQVSLMMAGAQLGITICSLGLGAVGEPAVAHLLEKPFASTGVPEGLLHPVAFAVALTIVVSLHMVIGEMVPKNIALAGPERSALLLGPPLFGIVQVLRPLIWLLNRVANLVLRAIRVEPKDEVTSAFTQEEVSGLVAESRREGLLDEEQHRLVTGALEFGDQTAADVAIPVERLVTVSRSTTVAEVEELCARTGFSRFPVVEGEQMVGYLHLKDLLATDPARRHQPFPGTWVRSWVSVRADDSLRQVLTTMQRRGTHLARVVQPDTGAVVGVAALEDVLEEIVGEVRDATQGV
ncbi:MAG TPA: hemolysin family protein, partial [Nocardioidaceae bacterium]|nr:hemolysin family protein [Nocardioidaceae bacterium]